MRFRFSFDIEGEEHDDLRAVQHELDDALKREADRRAEIRRHRLIWIGPQSLSVQFEVDAGSWKVASQTGRDATLRALTSVGVDFREAPEDVPSKRPPKHVVDSLGTELSLA